MRKRLLCLLISLIILTFIGSIYIFSSTWLRYGDHQTSLQNTTVTQTNGTTEYHVTGTVSHSNAIVIFPANLVSPDQYSKLAGKLTNKTHQPVFVLQPRFRVELWGNVVTKLQRQHPTIVHWTYIGHSAGAAAACKTSFDEQTRRPLRIIIVAGYCSKSLVRPSLAILARSDRWISYKQHESQASQTIGLTTNDHFFITDRHTENEVYDIAVEQLLRAIISN